MITSRYLRRDSSVRHQIQSDNFSRPTALKIGGVRVRKQYLPSRAQGRDLFNSP
jgi:hypothetical protein